MLRAEYGDAYDIGKYKNPTAIMKRHNLSLADIHLHVALESLRSQLKAYVNNLDPFNWKLHSTDTTRTWWEALQQDELANVLAILSTIHQLYYPDF